MRHITFHLDFISPYAYLAFEQFPEALKGISYSKDGGGNLLDIDYVQVNPVITPVFRGHSKAI